MYEQTYERLDQPLEEVLRHLTNVPLTEELAPGVLPGEMPFLKKLHERQRATLETEYRSKTLVESNNPSHHELSFAHEAIGYIESMPLHDQQAAASLADQLTDKPVPRTSICLPVASHEEGWSLYTSLEHYTKQSLPKDQFEVFLFLNRPAVGKDGSPTDDTETLEALAAFKRDYPNALNISEASTVFTDPLNLGALKKLHFDAHILRCLKAGVEDPIIIMNDVDMVHAKNEYLEGYVAYFDESPLVDAVVGEFDLDHGAYVKYPFVHVANRLHNIVSTFKGNSAKRIVNSNNSAMRASAYCALGGNTKMQRSSDSYMGVALTELRQSDDTVLRPQHPSITTQTSARRVVSAWLHGYAPNEKWKLNLGAHNSEVRKLPDGINGGEELFDFSDEQGFDTTLEYALNRLISNYETEDDDPLGWDSPIYREAMGLLGITFSVEYTGDNVPSIKIGDTTTLRNALDIFRQNHLHSIAT